MASDYPIAVNPTTGQRRQWNGQLWVDLPDTHAPGASYLPQGGQFGKDVSEAANFNKWRQTQEQGVNNARNAVAQDREMEGLLTRQKTGGALALPVIGDAMALFDPELRRMESLQSEAARSKRTPGEGTISDFDARMFLQQVYGKGQPTATNRAIIQAGRLRSDAVIQRRQMADWYYSTYGSMRGFDEAWDRYADDNPIFDPASEAAGRPILNAGRKNWRQYYGAARGMGDERPSQAQADIQRAEARRTGRGGVAAPKARASNVDRDYFKRMQAEGRLDTSKPVGDRMNPYVADLNTARRLPVGSWVVVGGRLAQQTGD